MLDDIPTSSMTYTLQRRGHHKRFLGPRQHQCSCTWQHGVVRVAARASSCSVIDQHTLCSRAAKCSLLFDALLFATLLLLDSKYGDPDTVPGRSELQGIFAHGEVCFQPLLIVPDCVFDKNSHGIAVPFCR